MIKGHRNINSLYEIYCKNTVEGLIIQKKQFVKILKRFNKLVIDKVLEAEEVKIPIIGTLRVQKIKQNYKKEKLKVDWAETKRLGKRIYHLNEDRGGYYYAYKWRKNKIHGISYYSFIPAKYTVKRRLPKFLKENPEKDFYIN